MEYAKLLELTNKILSDLEYSHMTGEWAYDHQAISKNIEGYNDIIEDLNAKQLTGETK